MTAFAIAHLTDVEICHEILQYLRRIDDTLEPFGGRFLVHGATPDPKDGDWKGNVIVIAFPSLQHAQDWYYSPAYQEILPLRTEHSSGAAVIVPGVPAGYRAEELAAKLAGSAPSDGAPVHDHGVGSGGGSGNGPYAGMR